MKINTNATVEVVLTETGVKAIEKHEDRVNLPPANLRAGDTWQGPLWEMAQIFGPVTYHGMVEVPFLGNVLDLTEVPEPAPEGAAV